MFELMMLGSMLLAVGSQFLPEAKGRSHKDPQEQAEQRKNIADNTARRTKPVHLFRPPQAAPTTKPLLKNSARAR